MDPDSAGLPERVAPARQVLAFAESAGDQSAIRIAGTVLIELLAQAGDQASDAGAGAVTRAALPGPRTTGGPA